MHCGLGAILFTSLWIWQKILGSTIFTSMLLNKSITYLSSMLINIYRHSRSYPIKSLYKHYTSMELLICSFTQAWVNTDSFNKLYWVYLLCSYFTELFGGIYTSNIWIKTRKMFTVIVHRSVKRVKSKVLSITYEIFDIP